MQSPPPTLLAKVTALVSRSAGRDKVMNTCTQTCKLLQYGCLFFSEMLKEKGDKLLEKKFLKISLEMRIVRKMFRFARTVEFVKRIL